tara:strand:- start:876 stop:2780 length:1905 start_codon:yes stop_codon:yes gene_type:complete
MKYFDKTSLITFFVISIVGILEHILIFNISPQLNLRIFQSLSLGFGYDIMNGAMLGLLVLFMPLPTLYRNIISVFLGVLFMSFIFTDYNYVLLFGTHLPFSTLEYLKESESFFNSAIQAIKGYPFWILFVFPILSLIFLLYIFAKNKITKKMFFLQKIISFFVFIILGGGAASYSNSYVSKNMEDPLTSAAIQYFYLSRNREPIEKISRPSSSLNVIKNLIPGKVPIFEKWSSYPLVRLRKPSGCENSKGSNNQLNICSILETPNILILMLESFRAAEVGIYGSVLELTPNFDYWSKKGILFKNFYANGFQTRHGQVATYCSLFPNYGAAVMKKYYNNNFMCLPEILRRIGYKTSWVFGSDSNFDGQSSFLNKIGFEKIIDKFSFKNTSSTLGWGLSDYDLFRELEKVLDNERQPFFSSALTSTNHHPFEVPDEYKLNRGETVKFRYQEAIFYTDAMLGDFLNRIKKKHWYKNTIIFITSDTASFQQAEIEPSNFGEFVKLRSKIPLLILFGENVIKSNLIKKTINNPASQVDIAPTILDILNKEIIVPWVGRSILENKKNSSQKIPFRAYTNRPGSYWAVIENNSAYYRENNNKDHFFGDQVDERMVLLKKIGESWIDSIRWILQENIIWPND